MWVWAGGRADSCHHRVTDTRPEWGNKGHTVSYTDTCYGGMIQYKKGSKNGYDIVMYGSSPEGCLSLVLVVDVWRGKSQDT